MNKYSEMLAADFERYAIHYNRHTFLKYLFGKSVALKFLCWFRLTQCCENQFVKKVIRKKLMMIERKYGLEIPDTVTIGALYLGHPYGITVNPETVIGNNVSLHKGVTLGAENRGIRKGAPTIGNNVWIGISATVVGNISVGNDVLIASNAFVNVDIPDHSVVIDNPCKFVYKENATDGYIR